MIRARPSIHRGLIFESKTWEAFYTSVQSLAEGAVALTQEPDTGAGRSCGEGSEGGTWEPAPTQPQPDVATARGTWAGGGAVGQSHALSLPRRETQEGKKRNE